jgi:hypothetical protein
MDDDFLLFDDLEDEAGAMATNFLVVGTPAATSEALSIRERAARNCADFARASLVLFVEDDTFQNAGELMRAMKSSTMPTLEQASAWLQDRRNAVDAVVRAAAAGEAEKDSARRAL